MPTKFVNANDLYKEDPSLKKEDVQCLEEWMKMQPHLPQATELQLILFLQSCYYSNEQAKSAIDTYFTVKTLCPDIFGNRVPTDPAIQSGMNCVLLYPLPKQTPTGDTVILTRVMDTNPDNYNIAVQLKLFDMLTLLHLHQYGPAKGIIILCDLEGISFAHFLKLSVVVLKKFFYYLQEGMPIRLKSIQYINVVSFMDKFLALIKPLMKKELFDMIVLHTNLESLYKSIPKDLLPQDYGGACESFEILQEKYKANIRDNANFFKFEESQVVDESKRPGKPKNIGDVFGMEGTFKKLDVD